MYVSEIEIAKPVEYLSEKLQAKQEIESVAEIICSLVRAIEKRDFITGSHCERVANISEAFGRFVNLSAKEVRELKWGAYIHDVGKIGIPDSILMKPGKLTPQEYEVMKKHTIIGEEICQTLKPLQRILPIIRSHHERWDGTGYPDGLKGSEIPDLVMLFQFVDIYEALTSERPYKKACSKEEALEILWEEADLGWRSLEIMEEFNRFVWDYGEVLG